MKRRILLVDDEAAILLTLKTVLEMNGFEVTTAASAAEGIEKLHADAYHMVITDMRMETDTSGYEVVREARKQSYSPAIALLTAYPSLVAGSEWKTEGADALLIKPMHTGDLLRQIEALLIRQEDKKQKRSKKSSKSVARAGRLNRQAR